MPNIKQFFHTYKLVIIPILFLLFTWPNATQFLMHFPDEKHYTDAAISMANKGDLITPLQSSGEPRFKKPIITYWIVLAGYKLFGINQFSSRIFFWIIGALTIFTSMLMTKSITGNKEKAWIVGLVMASNPLVILSSCRSIPDILLAFFITISAWGFLKILLGDHKKKFYWMAYMGAALAVESKGLPALAFALTSILFLLLNPWNRKKLKEIIEPISMIVSFLVASSWFIVMYILHGNLFLESFLGDQVSERVSINLLSIVQNMGLAILTLLLLFIPWCFSFLGWSKFKTYLKDLNKEKKAVLFFIVSWIILIIILSGFVFKFYDRYLLPVFPLFSILIASLIYKGHRRFSRVAFFIFSTLTILIILLEATILLLFKENSILLLGILASTFILVWIIKKKSISAFPIESLTITMALLFFNIFLLLAPLSMPITGTQLVNNLRKYELTERKEIYVYGNIRMASQMRVESSGKIKVISMNDDYSIPKSDKHVLIIPAEKMNLFDLDAYKVVKAATPHIDLIPKYPSSNINKFIQNFRNQGENYFIAYL